jgi:hypothetical protein
VKAENIFFETQTLILWVSFFTMGGLRTLMILALSLLLAVCCESQRMHTNSFGPSSRMDLRIYVSSSSSTYKSFSTPDLLWEQKGLSYCDGCDSQTAEVTHRAPFNLLQHNKTRLFAHVFFMKEGYGPSKEQAKKEGKKFEKTAVAYKRTGLIQYGARRKPEGLRNLLTGEQAPWEAVLDSVPESEKHTHIRYWQPTLHVNLVHDERQYAWGSMPQLLMWYAQGNTHDSQFGGTDTFRDSFISSDGETYMPIVFVNQLTVVQSQLVALNETLQLAAQGESGDDAVAAQGESGDAVGLDLEVHYSTLSISRFEWMLNLRQSFKMQEEQMGITEKDSEDLRGMFVNTNPYLLVRRYV